MNHNGRAAGRTLLILFAVAAPDGQTRADLVPSASSVLGSDKWPPEVTTPAVLVPEARWSSAAKQEARQALVQRTGGNSAPQLTAPIRARPASPSGPLFELHARNLALTTPSTFEWRMESSSVPDPAKHPSFLQERARREGAVELRLRQLAPGARYLVDCELLFRASRSNRVNNVNPMPAFRIERPGGIATGVPTGPTLHDQRFHMLTAFVAVAGENVLRVNARLSGDSIADWLAGFAGCEVEPL